jgi:glyoxylase-like metal-dependent hydrolase (beta-lactamase superfamily II)
VWTREEEMMAAGAFEQVHERIWRVPSDFGSSGVTTATNVYVVRGAITAIVDTGVFGTPTNDVAPALASLGLSLGDVDLVVNTHGHFDHLGGNAEVKDAGGAEIALHRADLPLAESNEHHARRLRELYPVIDADHLRPAREAMTMRLLGRAVGVDRVLDDGDVVDLGSDVHLTVVHTPGHTGGSVCYYWEAAGLLFTGDSIQARGVHAGALPIVEMPGYYADSLRRARDMRPSALLMGHGFQGPGGALGPVALGSAVADVFDESLRTHNVLSLAFATALAEAPDAPGGEVARRAIELAGTDLRFNIDPTFGFPWGFFYTLPGYLQAARAVAASSRWASRCGLSRGW